MLDIRYAQVDQLMREVRELRRQKEAKKRIECECCGNPNIRPLSNCPKCRQWVPYSKTMEEYEEKMNAEPNQYFLMPWTPIGAKFDNKDDNDEKQEIEFKPTKERVSLFRRIFKI